MAAEDEGRTEEASEYRLEKARKEGRVPKSQEIASSLVLLLGVLLLVFLGKSIFNDCIGIFSFYFNKVSSPDFSNKGLIAFFYETFLKIILPVSGVGIIASIIANIIQNKGFIYSLKPITPKFKNIVPNFSQYFKKTLFSKTGLFNFIKSIGKVAAIVIIAFNVIKNDIFILIDIINNGQILKAIGKIASMGGQLLLIVSILFLIISIPDYFVQKREFKEQMKMTKQEVKEEYKEMEGDPEVKGKLKSMQQQLLTQNIPKAVRESDVVITNPTHFAVALKYDETKDNAPKVTAKGEDQTALFMRRIAQENNVPVVENRPVARGLYTETQVGDIIPDTYYKAISLIYSKILNSDNN